MLDARFDVGGKLHWVPNGFDPEELGGVTAASFEQRAIVYAGSFYPPKRVIGPLFDALRHVKNRSGKNPPWRFHYYGPDSRHVEHEAMRYGIKEHVMLHGWVPRTEVLKAIKGADLAVVITSVSKASGPEDRGIVPAKVFETIGLGTPILVIGPSDGDLGSLISQCESSGSFSAEHTQCIADFISHRLMNSRRTPRQFADTFSWPNVSEKLDHILRPHVESDRCRD